MIINLENRKVNVKFEDKRVQLPQDGQVICVTDIIITEDTIELICNKSDYAHYLYGERIGLPTKYSCRNLSAGCLLETSDGCFVVGELDKLTSYPGMLQLPGGNIDNKEVKEEINIDMNNQNQVKEYNITNIYINDEDEQAGVEIFTLAKLNMTSEEMRQYYRDYYKYLIDNGLEVELGTIHFIRKERCAEILENMNNPKRKYLIPLLKKCSREHNHDIGDER